MPETRSPAPTFDDVWRALMQLQEQLKASQREADKRMQETDRRMQETDRQIQETARRIQETDQIVKQTAKRIQETDKLVKQISKQIGELGDCLGNFVEEMVKPTVVKLFQARGLNLHQVSSNLVAYDDNGQFVSEIDVLVINQDTAIAIEYKTKLAVDDVKEHLERLNQFKQNFPQYANYQLLAAVAAMVIPDAVGRYAYQQGLFVMAQSGEAMRIKNDGNFSPKIW